MAGYRKVSDKDLVESEERKSPIWKRRVDVLPAKKRIDAGMDTEDYAKAEDGAVDGDTCGEKAAQYIKDKEENLKNEAKRGTVDTVDGVEVKVIPNDGALNGKQVNGMAEKGESSGGSEGSEEEEENGKKKKKKEKVEMVSYGELFKYADRKDVILMLVGSFFAVINGMLQPVSFIVFGELINKFIIDANEGKKFVNGTMVTKTIDIEDEMTTFAAYYCYIALGMLTSAYFQTAFWSLAAIRQAHRMRLSFFGSVMRQEIGWFDTTDSGELSTRLVDDVTKVQNGIGDKIGLSIQSTTMFFGGFIIGFVYGWKLTLVILALTPALLVTAGITGKVIGSFTSQEQTAYAKAGSVAEEVLGSIRTVVAFGGEEKELDRYTSHLDVAERAGVKKGATTGLAFGLFHIVIFSCYALAFWYGSTLVAAGELEGGELLIVFFCVMIGAAQMGQAGPNFEALANARGAALQVIRIIDRKSQIDPVSHEGRKPDHMIGDVDFLKVHFEYPSRPDVKILNGLSLSIKSGQTVALVGESGCGKSTTIKLVQRFYDTIQGAVTIDGIDVRDLNVAWLRAHIGVVSQEPLLFDMTISDNIRMGNPNASQADIERAAKDANAHNFIAGLPKKYDTNVGEGGAQLSGGQKQRIAIARALVKDPKILLLDEATSALDTESESIVQSALDRASEGRTTIIIAHRLSTVKKADMIAAVQDGRVAEVGTHDELMEKRGVYFQLVMLQTAVEEDEVENDGTSILSEEEREQKLALKYMRTLSTLSTGSENEKEVAKQIEMVLHRRLSRKSSAKSRPRSAKTPDKKGKKKEEEEKEVENIEIPPITRIFKLNAKEWPYLLIGSIFASIVGAFPVVFAIILSEILESFSFTDTEELKKKARFWSLIFLALGFADAIGLFVSSFLFAKAGEVLTKRLRHFAFKAMLRQDIGYHDEPLNSTGALTARLASDTSGVQGATSSRLSTMVQVVVMGLTAIILAFAYQWKLTLLILAFVPFLAFGGAMQTKMSTSFAAEEKQKMVDAGALATEAIINVRTVASLGREDYFVNKYKDLLYVTYKKSKIRAQVYGLSFGSSMAVMMFANAASFRLGGYLVARGEVKFDDMFKVVLAIVFGAMIAGQIASFAPDYVKAKISAARLFRLFDTVPRIDSYSEEGIKLDHIEGTVEFRDVKFAYPSRPDVQVLKGLNICIRPGQTLALVGASGCGKSTSVGLLERFYNVAEGIVLIDGHDIKSLNIKWLRSQLGIVSQEPVLFDSSIADNIRYGVNSNEREVTQSEVEEAAKSANIHHFISSLPKGYDTMVGDKGTLISGGQKQRIAIARALLRDPRILLLDEATSALDSESEKVVQDALDVAMEGRTAIIIAHRLSTIQNADVIAVIQGGEVVEQGSHAELIAKKGAYYLLNEAQI